MSSPCHAALSRGVVLLLVAATAAAATVVHYDTFQPYPLAAKRANTAGFVGMRGKKDYEESTNDHDELFNAEDKRAGFVGMRGKKSNVFKASDNDDDQTDNWARMEAARGFFDARNRRAGFVGMRGKKRFDEMPAWLQEGQGWLGDDWMAAARSRRGGGGSSFVGMRG